MRDKKKTLDKENKNLKLKKRVKKRRIQERGITLIALVVTIIILLILVGVTLNIALSDNGLFGKAKKAAEEYKQAQSKEEDLISQFATQMYSEYVGAEVTGYTPTSDSNECTLESETTGSATDQTIDTEPEMKWRVWDYDGNTLRIIGDPTKDTLELKGAAGYNNGVWAINHICEELYSNKEKGATATNLKRTDIQKVSTYDYTKYKHGTNGSEEDKTVGNSSSIYFGSTKVYDANNQYPKMWEENDKNWTYEYSKDEGAIGRDRECKIWEEIGTDGGKVNNEMNEESITTTFKQSYYYHYYEQNEFINSVYYDLIFKKTDGSAAGHIWLAGRYVFLAESHCDFGIQRVSGEDESGLVAGNYLCANNNTTVSSGICQLRPIVSINLKENGYEMKTEVSEDGKMTIKLE